MGFDTNEDSIAKAKENSSDYEDLKFQKADVKGNKQIFVIRSM